MKTILHTANKRGHANFGWLDSHHSFSFGHYYDPEKVYFGMLRVLNDDIITGGSGFGEHSHDNMEIVSIPLIGALEHRDSTGTAEVIRQNDVQIMSAGSGVQHSEANASATESVTLFQIWVFPKLRNITPRYDQRTFNITDRVNKWQVIVSPNETDAALWINQDARFSLTTLQAGNAITYNNAFTGNGVYLVVISGSVKVNDIALGKRDAIGIYDTNSFTLTANENAELLAIEVPMN